MSRDVKLQLRIDFDQTSTNTSIDREIEGSLTLYMFAVVGCMFI